MIRTERIEGAQVTFVESFKQALASFFGVSDPSEPATTVFGSSEYRTKKAAMVEGGRASKWLAPEAPMTIMEKRRLEQLRKRRKGVGDW